MNITEQVKEDVHIDVRERFLEILDDYYDDISCKDLVDYAVENVLETSGLEDENIYNQADVNLAVQRSLAHHLYEARNYEVTHNPKVTTLLEKNNEYNWLEVKDDELDIIYKRTVGILDNEVLELAVNKLLLDFGYVFDVEYLKWIKE